MANASRGAQEVDRVVPLLQPTLSTNLSSAALGVGIQFHSDDRRLSGRMCRTRVAGELGIAVLNNDSNVALRVIHQVVAGLVCLRERVPISDQVPNVELALDQPARE